MRNHNFTFSLGYTSAESFDSHISFQIWFLLRLIIWPTYSLRYLPPEISCHLIAKINLLFVLVNVSLHLPLLQYLQDQLLLPMLPILVLFHVDIFSQRWWFFYTGLLIDKSMSPPSCWITLHVLKKIKIVCHVGIKPYFIISQNVYFWNAKHLTHVIKNTKYFKTVLIYI